MIEFDVHVHSIASGHGTKDTITDLTKEAAKRGLQLLGISDHGPKTPGSATTSYFRGLKHAPSIRSGMPVIYGAETDIMDDEGNLDLCDEILAELDYVIASMHPCNRKPSCEKNNTIAYMKAMENPHVKIIGHCDDGRYPVNMQAMVLAAKKHHVLLEVNNASLKEDSYRINAKTGDMTMLHFCKEYCQPVILSSDSHGRENIGDFTEALELVRALDFPRDLILNYNVDAFRSYIAK